VPQVYITLLSEDAEEVLARLITLPKNRFKLVPVVPAQVDEPLRLLLSRMHHFRVHQSDLPSYLPILRSIDSYAGTDSPGIMNVSLSPGPGRYDPDEAINAASSSVAMIGHAIVFAAGNDGPKEGTLSPWSVAPWVIGAGAANAAGDELLPESSVGDPANPALAPTVVAPGETVVPLREEGTSAHGTMVALVIIGKDIAGQNRPGLVDVPFRGTSVAAPKVARICNHLMFILKTLVAMGLYVESFLPRNPSADDVRKAIDQAARGASERRVAGASPHLAQVQLVPDAALAPLFRLFTLLSRLGIFPGGFIWEEPSEAPFPTSALKGLLKAMARPMPGYKPHQVGAGFVDDQVCAAYLARVSRAGFIRAILPSRAHLLGTVGPDPEPLFHPELIAEARRQSSEAKLVSHKVVV
jgi:hypothetical protein